MGKECACNVGDTGDKSSIPGTGEMTNHSSILAEKSHGQRSLVGYSPKGCIIVGHSWVMKHVNRLKAFPLVM